MNDLEKFFFDKEHRMIHKWKHYFEVYDRYFKPLQEKKINLLEIGISHGGSLEMWQYYFKNHLNIYAVDINPECKKFESENVKIFIGSQEDKNFLKDLKQQIPKVDIMIDDGGHTMKQQITTFEILFDHIADNGIYICEDLHTSYWKFYGGGYKKKNSFIEYSKNLIDLLHAWHTKKIKIDNFTKSAFSIHFYDSMMVIEKRKIEAPYDVKSGKAAIEDKLANDFVVKRK